jgi:hypothetical protein
MVPSSILCRAQESLNLRKAADTVLDNVRRVATEAAAAWGKEAIAAERREERQVKVRAVADAAGTRRAGTAAPDEMAVSENPDRGHATDDSGS